MCIKQSDYFVITTQMLLSAYRFDRTGEGYVRTVYSFFYNLMVRVLFGVRMRDINFAFKLCRTRIFQHVELKSEGSFIDAELVVKALEIRILSHPIWR